MLLTHVSIRLIDFHSCKTATHSSIKLCRDDKPLLQEIWKLRRGYSSSRAPIITIVKSSQFPVQVFTRTEIAALLGELYVLLNNDPPFIASLRNAIDREMLACYSQAAAAFQRKREREREREVALYFFLPNHLFNDLIRSQGRKS